MPRTDLQLGLERRVEEVDRHRRRVALLSASSLCASVLLLVAFVACLADYLLRFDDVGVRILTSLAVIGVALAVARKWLQPVFRERSNLVSVARDLERQFPEMQHRLSSSLAFLRQSVDDPLGGSPALRRSVVLRTESALERFDWSLGVDRAPLQRALRNLLLVGAVVALVSLADIQGAGIAWLRLAMPWSSVHWPREFELTLKPVPERIFAGADLEIEVASESGVMPSAVNLELRWLADDSSILRTENQAMKILNGTAVQRLANVTQSVELRVFGGDDNSMDWKHVDVLPLPRLENLTIRATPPAYTSLQGETTTGPNLRVLAGTRLEVAGTASVALRNVRLAGDSADEEDPSLPNLKWQPTADGLGFSLTGQDGSPWLASRSRTFWIELQDLSGLVGRVAPDWNLRVIPDTPPVISTVWPEIPLSVTAEAQVAVRVTVSDDLAIKQVSLHLTAGAVSTDEFDVPIYMGDKEAKPRPDLNDGEKLEFEQVVDFTKLKGLTAGTVVEVRFAASDYMPQWTQFISRRMTIVTRAELEERLAREQSQLLIRLADILQQQSECRSRTHSLALAAGERLSEVDRNSLQVADLSQRRINQELGPVPGMLGELDRLLLELRINQIDTGEFVEQLRSERNTIVEVLEQLLHPAQLELGNALRASQGTDATANRGLEVNRGLELAEAHQGKAIVQLEELLSRFTRWDNYRRFARDIVRISHDQDELREQAVKRLQSDLAGENGTEESLERRRMSDRQAELAQRLEKISVRMAAMAVELESSDVQASARLDSAVNIVRNTALVGQLREIARSIEERRWGTALEQQARTLADLRELQALLSDERERQLTRQMDQLRLAQSSLRELSAKQSELHEQFSRVESDHDRGSKSSQQALQGLSAKQSEVGSQAEKLALDMRRSEAGRAAENTQRGGQSGTKAARAAEQGDAANATRHAADAQRDLAQAEADVARQLAATEKVLEEQWRQVVQQEVTRFIERELGLLADWRQLTGQSSAPEKQPSVSATPDMAAKETLAISARQRVIADDALRFADTLETKPVFREAMQQTANRMVRSVTLFKADSSGNEAGVAIEAIVARLQAILAAVQESADDQENQQNPAPAAQPPPDAPENQQHAAQNRISIAELKMLHWFQRELHSRTVELHERQQLDGGLSAEQEEEFMELAAEQWRLVDIVNQWMRSQQ